MSSTVFHPPATIPEFLIKYYQDWQRKSTLLEHIHFLNEQNYKEMAYRQTVLPGLPVL